MLLPSVVPAYRPLDFAGGTLLSISFEIKCVGVACDAVVKLHIYEGSWLPTHGTKIAEGSQEVSFAADEVKTVTFEHEAISTSQARRDVGIEILVDGFVFSSQEWDDAYYVTETGAGGIGGIIGQIVPIIMMVMMMSMISPMTGEGEGEGGLF